MAKKASKKAPAKKKVTARKPARKAAAKKASAPRAAPQPKWKPKGVQDVIANLVMKDAAGAIEFYKRALGAVELMRHPAPDGKGIWHAELRIGDSVIALNDEMPMSAAVAAGPSHKPTANFMIYTPDCDALFNRAVSAGAKAAMPLADMFWGDRMGSIADPYGQVWMIATHIKDMTFEEQAKAGAAFAAQMAAQHQPLPSPAGQPPPTAAGV